MRSLNAVPLRAESFCTSAAFEAALKTAAENAEDVDRQARFPKEAIAALESRLSRLVGTRRRECPAGGRGRSYV
jgi:hypothetical protein